MDRKDLRGEVDNCRHRVLKYCQGQGLDIGCGVTKIKSDSIGIDLVSPLADMKSDGRILSDFPDEHFDYIFSSHMLEEIDDTEAILKEWLRVLKKDGYIVLYQADRDYYYPLGHELCNKRHKHHFIWEELWAIFDKIGGTKLIHHKRYGEKPYDEWSFELVVKKTSEDDIIEKTSELISILIPTLNRPDNMEKLSRSINDTSQKPELVEVAFGIHNDDKASIEKAEQLNKELKIHVNGYVIKRFEDNKPHLSFFWNQLYEKTSGEILGYFGDDVIFKTPGWDEEVRKEFQKDKSVMVSCNDIHIQRGRTATLFFTHRFVHEKIGYYMHPSFRRWFTDTFWDNVYRNAGKMKYREDIITEHFHPDVFPEKLDATYRNMDDYKNSDRALWNRPETGKEVFRCSGLLKNLKIKKVISFSLWGNDPKYLIGAKENIKLQPQIYPGWVCRFYVDDQVPEETIKILKSNGAEIINKNRSDEFEGMMWRFEVMFDKTVDYFIIRDCDSRINPRESDAVREWLESSKPFHAMRDHKGHDVPILGAMWGAKTFFLPDIEKLFNDFITKTKDSPVIKRGKHFYYDQVFLNDIIWPKISDKALIHDDMKRFTKDEMNFKISLPEGQFVGQQYGADNKPLEIPL